MACVQPITPPVTTEKELSGWKLVERFAAVLDKHGGPPKPGGRERHGLRRLGRGKYLGLFLLGLFNPVLESARAACAASRLDKTQKVLGLDGPVSLSSFSDAQHVFAPEILEPVLSALLAESAARQTSSLKIGRLTPELIHVFDSTVWKVVTRMGWAEWRTQHGVQRAVRLHLKLRLSDLQPAEVEIGPGKVCERAAMRRMFKPGEFYLGDRNYGAEFAVFDELDASDCGFVLRMSNTIKWTVMEEYPLTDEAKAKGVILDALVLLGHRGGGGERRIVVKRTAAMTEDLVLVVSETPAELSDLEALELYRWRWQIEMFFRWLKCLVPCRHWLAESEDGVKLQIYLCLIKGLLLSLHLGTRPNKRMMELLHFHQMGWVGDDELAVLLAKEEETRRRREQQRAAAKKS